MNNIQIEILHTGFFFFIKVFYQLGGLHEKTPRAQAIFPYMDQPRLVSNVCSLFCCCCPKIIIVLRWERIPVFSHSFQEDVEVKLGKYKIIIEIYKNIIEI